MKSNCAAAKLQRVEQRANMLPLDRTRPPKKEEKQSDERPTRRYTQRKTPDRPSTKETSAAVACCVTTRQTLACCQSFPTEHTVIRLAKEKESVGTANPIGVPVGVTDTFLFSRARTGNKTKCVD